MLDRLKVLFLCVLATQLATFPTFAQKTTSAFSEDGLEALGEAFAAYLDARTQALGVEEARSAVTARLEELRAEEGKQDPLRAPQVLVQALRMGRAFDAAKAEKGRVRSEVFEHGSFGEAGLELTFRLPKEYEPEEQDYPLILAIPDEGESPAEHIRSHWMAKDIRNGAIVVSFGMPEEVEGWDQVMVRGRPGGMAHVLSALRFASERYAVDPDRIYVAGRGAGVSAALATGNYSPQRFAGIIGRAGDASELSPDNFHNLPTCFTESGEKAEAFEASAADAGHANVTRLLQDDDQLVWSWIREHARDTYPEHVRLVTGDPFPTRVNWLRIAPSAPGANASAKIDRDKNALEITTEGVSHVTLYLNDALVDLQREVRVVCNGIETTAVLERHVPSALDMLYDGTSDSGCLYVTRVTYEASGEDTVADTGAASGPDEEYEQRLADAGEVPESLWKLSIWCAESGREHRGQSVLRKLVRLAPNHQEGRQALGLWGGDGQWFRTREAFERFQRSQDEVNATLKGHVLNKGLWIHSDERSAANKGWFKDFTSGQWLSRSETRRLAEGWGRQDLEWIGPEDAAFVDEGLWQTDGDWVDLKTANRRHARLGSSWQIPAGEVFLYTTVDRHIALRAAENMGRAIEDLQRVFGAQPVLPIEVALLRDEEQYDRFAFGDPDGKRLPAHTGRLHSIHSAFFAESWRRPVDGKLLIRPMGVGYWDANAPNGDLFGVHAARLAVGLSYVDKIDPSKKTLKRALSRGLGTSYYEDYQSEKQLPSWLRYGGAVYAERYFRDTTVTTDGDPWWARQWSLGNLERLGGLRGLEEIFAFQLDPEDREDSQKLLLEAGLLVAFLVDGECVPVTEKHEEFKRAMVTGGLHAKHVRGLVEVIGAHQEELHAFTGF